MKLSRASRLGRLLLPATGDVRWPLASLAIEIRSVAKTRYGRGKHGASRLLEEPTGSSRRNSRGSSSFRMYMTKGTLELENQTGEFRSEWWPGFNTPPTRQHHDDCQGRAPSRLTPGARGAT